jgi:hypothetical protein
MSGRSLPGKRAFGKIAGFLRRECGVLRRLLGLERRPVIAASVPGMGMDLSYEKK